MSVSFLLFVRLYSLLPTWAVETNINNALYMLSSLIQSEAAILGIVVTLSLVAVQLTASSYSTRVISLFKNSVSLWLLIIIYIFTIIYTIGVLKIIYPIADFSNHEFLIWIAYLLAIYAFLALIPYILDILDLMKPETIIHALTREITKGNINSFIKKANNDPIQPVMDIIIHSLMKNDYGTLREGLIEIGDRIRIILNEEKNYKEEKEILNHIFLHLSKVAQMSSKIIKDEVCTLKLNDILQEGGEIASTKHYEISSLKAIHPLLVIGNTAADENLDDITLKIISSLEKLGITFAQQRFKTATPLSIHYLEEIGINTAERRLNKSTNKIIDSIEKIGLKSAENKLKKTTRQAIYSLEKVGQTAAEQNLETKRRQAINSIQRIGKKSAEEKFKDTTLKAIRSLMHLGKTSEKEVPRRTIAKVVSSLKIIGKTAAEKEIEKTTKATISSLVIIMKEASQRGLENTIINALYSIEKILTIEKRNIELSEDIKKDLKKIFLEFSNEDKIKFTKNIEDLLKVTIVDNDN